MVWTDMTRKALAIMFEAHKNDVDKAGAPYVFHPFTVAQGMTDETSCCVALLHDLLEDHGDVWSAAKLKDAGFTDDVIRAVLLLTRAENQDYMEYVRTLATNDVARRVKIADLENNMDISRTGGVKPTKYGRYAEALRYLKT